MSAVIDLCAEDSDTSTPPPPHVIDLSGESDEAPEATTEPERAREPPAKRARPSEPPARRARPNPPPAVAEWRQTLSKGHTDPKALPGQELTCHWKEGPDEVRVSRTPHWSPFEPGTFRGTAETIRAGGVPVATLLRNFDGQNGRHLAARLEGTYGVDVLSGRGTQNKCSDALEDRRITTDRGNFDSCSLHKDTFAKLWPLLGSEHGGNADGDVENAAWAAPLLDGALAAADRPPASLEDGGSVQILRFRSADCALAPKKKGKASDTLHMHVDQDFAASTIVLLSLGDTARMVFDRGVGCRRLACCDRVPGLAKRRADLPPGEEKKRALDEINVAKTAWLEEACPTCAEFDLNSGDVLLFDGAPTAGVAHGVLGTRAGTAPGGMPAWAIGCRVSLQYRQRRPPR